MDAVNDSRWNVNLTLGMPNFLYQNMENTTDPKIHSAPPNITSNKHSCEATLAGLSCITTTAPPQLTCRLVCNQLKLSDQDFAIINIVRRDRMGRCIDFWVWAKNQNHNFSADKYPRIVVCPILPKSSKQQWFNFSDFANKHLAVYSMGSLKQGKIGKQFP